MKADGQTTHKASCWLLVVLLGLFVRPANAR